MLQCKVTADVFGALTIVLLTLLVVLGLFCIAQSLYFRLRIRQVGFLCFFSGPWITRIALILIIIWWVIGEIFRLNLVKGRLFSSLIWQQNICKAYILSNLGFAEPGIFFVLVFLLHSSLRQRDAGTLSPHWNEKSILYIALWCIPVFVMQSLLLFVAPDFLKKKSTIGWTRMEDYFIRTSYLVGGFRICTYPLLATLFLGIIDAILMSYVSYVGSQVLFLVINKGLQKRVSFLISTVLFLHPMRVVLLGFSVLAVPGDIAFQCMVFSSFLMMVSCMAVGIVMLVYYPIADSLKLTEFVDGETGRPSPYKVPVYEDYYLGGSLQVPNLDCQGAGRSSEVLIRTNSMAMLGEGTQPAVELDSRGSSHGAFEVGSSSGSSQSATHPMLPLNAESRY